MPSPPRGSGITISKVVQYMPCTVKLNVWFGACIWTWYVHNCTIVLTWIAKYTPAYTVECLYNTGQYNMILHTSLQWLKQNIVQSLNPYNISRTSPWRANLCEDFGENLPRYNGTVLYILCIYRWVYITHIQKENSPAKLILHYTGAQAISW